MTSQTSESLSEKPNQLFEYLVRFLGVAQPEDYFLTAKYAEAAQRAMSMSAQEREQFFKSKNYFTDSASILGEIIRTQGRSLYSNSMDVGKPGVGKSFLEAQLVFAMTFGLYPESFKQEVGEGTDALSNLRSKFIGKTDILVVNNHLLNHSSTQSNGPWNKADDRKRTVLSELFTAAQMEYQSSGRHTLFLLEEMGELNELVQEVLKATLDKTGWQGPNSAEVKPQAGFSVVGFLTPADKRKMIHGDGAIERRYKSIEHTEITEDRAFEIVKEKAETIWNKNFNLTIEDEAIRYIIRMRRMLTAGKEQALPASILTAVNDLYLWKATPKNAKGGKPAITREDAHNFLVDTLRLPPVWRYSDGKPPLHDLESKIRENFVGSPELVAEIAHKIKTWFRFDFGRKPLVFFVGGPSRSGKNTLAKAVNLALFGYNGANHEFNVGSAGDYGVTALIEGPPLGNHSDKNPPVIIRRIEEYGDKSAYVFNEMKDAPSEQIEHFKVFFETGEVRPVGADSAPRQLTFPIFWIIGQWGEEAYQGVTQDEQIEKIASGMTQGQVEQYFMNGKESGARGRISQAVLNRAKESGGVYILKPVLKRDYSKIVEQILRREKADLEITRGLKLEATARLVDFLSEKAKAHENSLSELSALVHEAVSGAMSKLMDEGMDVQDVAIEMDYDPASSSIIVNDKGHSKSWSVPAVKLFREKVSCEKLLT